MSKVTIVKCDRCGQEITSDHTYKIYPQVADLQGDIEKMQPYDGELQLDYCEECAQAVLDFLHGQPKEVPPVRKPAKKKVLDAGKVLALKKAGWTNAKIADEMGVSQAAICQYLKKHVETPAPEQDV